MAQIIICAGIAVVPYLRPVGPYQLANVLRQQGYTVQVIDQYPWIAHLGVDTAIKLFDKFVGPDTLWIGYSSTWFKRIDTLAAGPDDHLPGGVMKDPEDFRTNTLLFTDEELYRIKDFVLNKNPNVKFVLGGGRAPAGRRGVGRPLIDYYIEGYADNTVVRFSEWCKDTTQPINALENKDGSKSIIDDHKATGFDYHNFKFRWHDSDFVNKDETLPMEIARGCIFNCAFCSYPLNGRKKMDYLKNPEVLREQFIDNYNRFNTTRYFFLDDTFNDSVEKLQILHDEVFAKLPFKIKFGAFMRLDLLHAHPETIPLLRDMGVSGVFLGIESLNLEANKAIGKGIGQERIIETLTTLSREWPDAILDGQFIMGLPNDSEETIRAWLDILLTPEFPLTAAKIEPLHLDSRKVKDNIWVSKFESNPAQYGYTFPMADKGMYWVNNKGFSLGDAIRIKKEYGKRWKIKERPAWMGDYGTMNIGISADQLEARKFMKADYKTSDREVRIAFVKRYIDKLLAS
ncbi:BchE, magnesium-protoporphyrin IX monomethyl ester anaerobic oxidative cyclase [uncultured Caudovirales phage]|uniref:BchE, magnesium-protoporphyrin IX monomethyl ester anaerobic oxidative cyclase n=1 Tax=uncultured Caudovirales phage TaxID=2100421 RepID=A0A6J5TA44_9CAUD|nr:BchE, magnesium-protoporphyrin IX monomethyl ester anaerobic oxidative cyclase [uncultured Caudovirales phage]